MSELTREDIRRKFLSQMWGAVDFWDTCTSADRREAIEGAVFSVLVVLDGDSGFPGVELTAIPHPDDKVYHETEGADYYPEGCEFGGGLHEEFYKG